MLGFGAGALISSVAFELAETGIEVGGLVAVAAGLGTGALVFFLADKAVTRMGGRSGGGRKVCRSPWVRCSTASPNRRCSASGWRAARV